MALLLKLNQDPIAVPATPTSDGAMSKADKAKLDGIPPSGGGVAAVNGTAPIISSGGTTPTISISPATPATPRIDERGR